MGEVRARILASLKRRPQTAAQLASALLAAPGEVQRALAELIAQGLAEEVRLGASLAGHGGYQGDDLGQVDAEAYFQART